MCSVLRSLPPFCPVYLYFIHKIYIYTYSEVNLTISSVYVHMFISIDQYILLFILRFNENINKSPLFQKIGDFQVINLDTLFDCHLSNHPLFDKINVCPQGVSSPELLPGLLSSKISQDSISFLIPNHQIAPTTDMFNVPSFSSLTYLLFPTEQYVYCRESIIFNRGSQSSLLLHYLSNTVSERPHTTEDTQLEGSDYSKGPSYGYC